VALQQTGKWTIGVLANQVWSVAGDKRRADVSEMFLQPFVAYQATKTVTYTVTSESTANWEAAGGDRWTVPLLGEISKLDKFGQAFVSDNGISVSVAAAIPGGFVVVVDDLNAAFETGQLLSYGDKRPTAVLWGYRSSRECVEPGGRRRRWMAGLQVRLRRQERGR
jgi:hypothetical protein